MASCSKNTKKIKLEKRKTVRITTLMRKNIKGHFSTFKPTEVILKLAEEFTGIKGIPESIVKEMDSEVKLNEDRKRFEAVLFNVHKAILSTLTAIVPVANRMMAQNKFTSLCDDMDKGLGLLAATSNYLSYRRFENIFKSVCTDAGK